MKKEAGISIQKGCPSHVPSSILLSLTMTTATQSATPVPELTSLNRLTAIPLIHELHETLSAYPLINRPYNVAQSLSSSALYYCGPIVGRLSPIIVRADGIANKGLDAVESRYPSTFTVHKEDLFKYARDVTNKTIDERVRDPAYTAVQGLDQVCKPLFFCTSLCSSNLQKSGLLLS
jgi:hypothetical protein